MVLISARLEPLPLYFIIRSRLWICMFIIINHSTYTDDHCLYNEYSLIKKTKKQKNNGIWEIFVSCFFKVQRKREQRTKLTVSPVSLLITNRFAPVIPMDEAVRVARNMFI